MTCNTLKRRLLRVTPLLSRVATALDTLEDQNQELRRQLAQRIALRSQVLADASETPEAGDVPLPPRALRLWVAGTDDLPWFLDGGQRAAQTITDVLAKEHLTIGAFDSVLDFGCGCGRVIRHLRSYDTVSLHGSDCNAAAIQWCDENLNFAAFGSNTIEPPTRYRKHSFDLIFAFSVFTHLTEPLQLSWMRELHRVLRPNGYLIVSVHGDHYLPQIPEPERESYRQGSIVVTGGEELGLNECSAFHPERYVRNVMVGELFRVCHFCPEGALGNPRQDVYLLQATG